MTPRNIIFATLLLAPIYTYAQATGLVPCSGADCQACDVLKLIQNLINAAISIATFLAIIGLAWNGFLMVAKGGDSPLAHTVFKQKLKNIVIGFLLMLSAWVIVDTVMKLFLKEQQFGNWHKIECAVQPTAIKGQLTPVPGGKATTGTTGTATSTPTVVSSASAGVTKNTDGTYTVSGSVSGRAYSCTSCVDLKAMGFNCKESQCYLDKSAASKLASLNSSYAIRVTEAMPPTVRHSNSCQYDGTCVDATISSVTTASQVISFMSTAKSNGIRPVWEGESCETRNQIRAAGGEAFCKSDSGYGHITGTHYSLYAR